jgi:hypothetical protein
MASNGNARLSVGALTVILMMVGSGCRTMYLQTDGFPDKLKAGCRSERECRALVTEAEARVEKCMDNTIGYIPCKDARGDLRVAAGYVAEYDRAAEARKQADHDRRAAEERRRSDEARDASRREADAARKQALRDREKEQLQAVVRRAAELQPRMELCERTTEARQARKRHAELEATAGFVVRKSCTPVMRGLVVASYSCPKAVDPEVAAIGNYTLLHNGYPYPEDETIRVTDAECDRLKELAVDAERARKSLAQDP